jgi:hypothetical protein
MCTTLKNALKTYPLYISTAKRTILAVSALFLCCFGHWQFSLITILSVALLANTLFFLGNFLHPVSVTYPKTTYMPSAQKNPMRLLIYPADIMSLHNCSDSTAARKLKLVRQFLDKKEHQVVSIKEYCDYWGLDYEESCQFLKLL